MSAPSPQHLGSLENAILYLGQPDLNVETLCDALNTHLPKAAPKLEEISPAKGAVLSMRAPGALISITVLAHPLGADSFNGALESPLSKPFLGVLSHSLAHHSHHVLIRVSPSGAPDKCTLPEQLQLSHAVATCILAQHGAAAVHWRHSNQLLTGEQYLRLAGDVAPWALFVRARLQDFAPVHDIETERGSEPERGLVLIGAAQFVARDVRFAACTLPTDVIHAAALSFLKHVVMSGTPIPDGHSFGPKNGQNFMVRHMPPSKEFPNGIYELSALRNDADTVPDATARASGADPVPEQADDPLERTRSLAIGYLMLVIAPPLGALLLISNALFGSNSWRTGLVALASVALAMVLGAYTFLNVGSLSATLFPDEQIVSSVILEQ